MVSKKKLSKNELAEKNKIYRFFIFATVILSAIVYILWRLFFTLPLGRGIVSMIFGVILWIAESITVVEIFTHFYNAHNVKIPEIPIISEDMYPDVDILICTHNESADLLYKTVNGCKYMKYPDKDRVHICLCDDADRPEVRALAEHMEVEYLGFCGNKYAKAGNINYAISKTSSPLVAIFDADMIPTSDFLMETVPYFSLKDMIKENGKWRRRNSDEISDEKELGYVQTHQSFYNPDPLQKNLFLEKHVPNEQDFFYRAINVARTYTESAAFAGSNTLFSRNALEDAGGLATYSITEDLATSILVLEKGYKPMAIDKELAHGLSPEDTFSFIKQRQRWSRGSAQVVPNKNFFSSNIPFKTKWCFFVSYLYWWTFLRRAIFILCPILYGLFNISVTVINIKELLIIWLPYFLVYNTGLNIISGGTIDALWGSVVDTVQCPYLIWPIIAGTLKIPEKKFWVTPKDKVKGRNSSLKLATPHIVALVLCIISSANCIKNIVVDHYEGAIIVLFWLLYNIFTLVSSIIYYYGRVNYSNYERVPVSLPVTLYANHKHIEAIAEEISEDSITIEIEKPEDLCYGMEFPLTIQYKDYEAIMKVQKEQIHNRKVNKKNKDDKCHLVISEIEESEKNQYLQIIYDRDHSFSRSVDISFLSFVKIIYNGVKDEYKKSKESNKDKSTIIRQTQEIITK